MRNNIIAIIILIGLSTSAFSQKRTFIGAEYSFTKDIYNPASQNNTVSNYSFNEHFFSTFSIGLSVSQEINKYFLIETGIINKHYEEGFQYNNGYFFFAQNITAYSTFQIPLRLKSRFNLYKHKLFLTSSIGYNLCINKGYNNGYSHSLSQHIHNNDTTSVYANYNNSFTKTFSLIEASIGLEYEITYNILLSISSSYFAGFETVNQIEILEERPNSDPTNSYVNGNGSYFGLTIGVKYAISNFWNKDN